MITCQVNSGSLSSLMDTRDNIEIVPEPYRLQSNVVLGVPYSEYVNYIKALQEDSFIKLFSGTKQTIQSCSAKDPALYKSFLRDVAFAICKELFYSERLREEATVIVPVSNESAPLGIERFLRIANVSQQLENNFEKLLIDSKHSERIRSDRNKKLKRLAVTLYSLSFMPTLRGELNLTYDLS